MVQLLHTSFPLLAHLLFELFFSLLLQSFTSTAFLILEPESLQQQDTFYNQTKRNPEGLAFENRTEKLFEVPEIDKAKGRKKYLSPVFASAVPTFSSCGAPL